MNTNQFRIGKTFISITDPKEAVRRIENAANKKLNTYICVSNPRTVVHARKSEEYLHVMNNSYMNIPDAEPIPWAAKLWGLNHVERTMGPYLFNDMVTNRESGLRHYLLGDTQETLDAIEKKCREEYKANIVGTFSPPFCHLDDYDYKSIAKTINDSQADIVWLALRAPKQDFFSARLSPHLDSKICIGVGAAFRFFLGEYKVSSKFLKKTGLMGLFWGKKHQKFIPFLWGYISDNVPYLFLLMQIVFWRLSGRKYYQ